MVICEHIAPHLTSDAVVWSATVDLAHYVCNMPITVVAPIEQQRHALPLIGPYYAVCVCQLCVCVHYHFAMQRHYPVLRNVRSPGERSDSELQRAFWVIEERPSHEEHTKTVQSNGSQSAAIFRHTTLSLQNIPATHTQLLAIG